MPKTRLITYAQAIYEAINQSMVKDPRVFVIGEGVPDPKGIFGTTRGLKDKFGSDRVMDMPVSENGMTGICIGTAIRGWRPILTHQRVDFSLLSFDQIINNAAKWHFMFGGKQSVPIVIRMIIGRGWGQGTQHSQSLQSLFAHIPGLKVIMPTTAYDAKGMLISAIEDNNPVISLEHRWLFNLTSHVPEKYYKIPLGLASILQSGNDLTIAATSYCAIEAMEVANALKTLNISVEVVNIRSLKPLDETTIIESVAKTGRLLVIDTSWVSYGISGEIIASTMEELFSKLKVATRRIGLPDIPTPSAPELTKNYYPNKLTIAKYVLEMLGKNPSLMVQLFEQLNHTPHDVPDASFTGPF